LNTLLLEKEKMPRMKLCGGGVTPKVLKLLDFNLPEDIIESVPRSAKVHVGDSVFKFHSNRPLVYMTSRDRFDTMLASKAGEAGAEVRDGTMVQNLVTHPGFIDVKTHSGTFEAKAILGCDGTGGPTARVTKLYSAWNPDEVAYAVESEVRVGEKSVSDFMGSENYFDLYFGVSPAGYGWIFPKDDHLTVGVGCRLSNLRDGQQLFRNFVRHIPELQGRDIPIPRAHLIPLGGASDVPTVADRVLLAGDSAGFAEPLLGEGIYFAIWAGQIAAEVIHAACRTEKFDLESLNVYATRCQEAFGQDFRAAFRLARSSYMENYDMDRLATFFFSNRTFQNSMIAVMEGSMRYRDVQAKLAWLYLKYRLSRMGLPIRAW